MLGETNHRPTAPRITILFPIQKCSCTKSEVLSFHKERLTMKTVLFTWQWLLRKSHNLIDLSRLQEKRHIEHVLPHLSQHGFLDIKRTTCQRGRSHQQGSWPLWQLSCRGLQSTGCTCSQSGTCIFTWEVQVNIAYPDWLDFKKISFFDHDKRS